MANIRNIIAIGGGGSVHNFSIYEQAVKLTKKIHPRVLLIPTAAPGRNPAEIWGVIQECFGAKMNCSVSMLDLLFQKYSQKEIEKMVLEADLIYVSGGNTLRLVTVLKNKGVTALLKKAYQNGTVMMGESAGAICWHEFGHSDSRRELNPQNWKYICVAGFGYFPGLFCPHYSKARGLDFEAMLKRKKLFGIGLTDFAGIHYQNNEYRLLMSKPTGAGYIFQEVNQKIVRKRIIADGVFRPISSLLFQGGR